ncbi:MAG: tryptophanase [Proteobacteria bacterium]|nr:tryptophanase [Pseudomonadota bacterium]MCP4918623.1 tryptophanase [Pseudomonadota bacterium]
MDDWNFRTVIEPFRMKMVEAIPFRTAAQRLAALERAEHNLFKVPARDVTIDLLTDSGTGAMSANQWAALMLGDESYAGSRSFLKLEETVQEITGMPYVLPVHQGRAAERILATVSLNPGDRVLNNTHFDTTRAHVEHAGASAIDIPVAAAHVPSDTSPFKGDMDLAALDAALEEGPVAMVMLTLTNNAAGGQPVSMANIEAVSARCRARGVPFWLDAARYAENAWFIHSREAGFEDMSLPAIARRMFDAADGFTMSAKKDGIVNIGGLLCTRDKGQYDLFAVEGILSEGFPTYGGLAGRDLEALAVGLREALDPDYLRYRERSMAYFARGLMQVGIPVVQPAGGHAVYIDAGALCPQLRSDQFPGIAVLNALYLHGGVRGVEVGELMFPGATLQLVRLAVPRRVYTQAHIDYVIEVGERVAKQAPEMGPYRIVEAPPVLRHFSASLAPA